MLVIRAQTPIAVLGNVIEQFPSFCEVYQAGFELLPVRNPLEEGRLETVHG